MSEFKGLGHRDINCISRTDTAGHVIYDKSTRLRTIDRKDTVTDIYREYAIVYVISSGECNTF